MRRRTTEEVTQHSMGWETRRGHGRYYTRSRRVNGRVVREYVGGGLLGLLAAEADARRRAGRAAQAEAERAERARWLEVEIPLFELHGAVDQLAKAALLAANFRRHDRGEWRYQGEKAATRNGPAGGQE
jgi:hypothetical protein